MNVAEWILIAVAVALVLYLAFIVVLLVAGRSDSARAVAGFVPDCIVLVRRLLGDARLARSRKLLLWALIAYLALPIDIVPDFIPVAGQLDDVLVVALALRFVLRDGGALVRELWPGPRESLDVVLRLTY